MIGESILFRIDEELRRMKTSPLFDRALGLIQVEYFDTVIEGETSAEEDKRALKIALDVLQLLQGGL